MSSIPSREKMQRSVDRMAVINSIYYTIQWGHETVNAAITKRYPIHNPIRKDLSAIQLRLTPLIATPYLPHDVPATFVLTLRGLEEGVASVVPDNKLIRGYKTTFVPSNEHARKWLRNIIAIEACKFEYQSTPFLRIGGDETGDKVFS